MLTGWLIPTRQGIANARVKTPEEDARLKPFELVAAVPDQNFHKTWKWHDKTGALPDHQYDMWGPLAIPTPTGEQMGYVIMQKEPDPQHHTTIESTAEYQIVPGLGLVREIDSRVTNGVLVTRIEVSLRSMTPGSGDEPALRSLTGTDPAPAPGRPPNEQSDQQQILNDLRQ